MKQIYRILGVMAFLVALSCDLNKDLDNPNELGVDEANPDLLMNQIQIQFADFFARMSGNDSSTPSSGISSTNGMDQLVRMNAMTAGDTYDRAYLPQNMDQIWVDAYQGIMVNVKLLLPLAEEKGLTVHMGAAKVLQAYTMLTLVDVFGDVPFTDALKGDEEVFNPKSDGGADVYNAAIALLDDAKTDLGTDPELPLTRDVFYNGKADKWITLANTLQLKAYLNMSRSADGTAASTAKTAMQTLLTENDLIDTDGEEFTYKYGTSNIPIISRHPNYRQYYLPQAGAAGGYICNYFLKEVYDGNGIQDPRWRYYFYRQVGSIGEALAIDSESVPCVLSPVPSSYVSTGSIFCSFEPGFYGRDHGNNDGGPPDNNVITCPGAYPAGGRVDTNDGNIHYRGPAQQGQGGNGAGIQPIFMSWFVDFMKAEMALRADLNMPGLDARASMMNGVTKSINRTRAFAESLGQSLPTGLEPSQVAYMVQLGTLYDDPGLVVGSVTYANLNAKKLDIAMKEYYKSLYGNGIEAYNLYRRTSSPRNIQPVRSSSPGIFWRSMLYPALFVNLNNSTAQKEDGSGKVFWDGNPDDLK